MKRIFICHPITTGDATVGENTTSIRNIREWYWLNNFEQIPISPMHVFDGLAPVVGDQSRAYASCRALLLGCDEVHVYSNWQESEGCYGEVKCAVQHKIPIKYFEGPGQLEPGGRSECTGCGKQLYKEEEQFVLRGTDPYCKICHGERIKCR